MKFSNWKMLSVVTAALALVGPAPAAWAQAQHNEFPFVTQDYNNCTDEIQDWDVLIREVVVWRQTPSGQWVYVNMWIWDGTVEGQDSGYLWSSRGTAPYVERYALDGSLAGGFFVLENSVLHPLTQGAPRIRLDVEIRTTFNANGDLVVDQANYTYHCH